MLDIIVIIQNRKIIYSIQNNDIQYDKKMIFLTSNVAAGALVLNPTFPDVALLPLRLHQPTERQQIDFSNCVSF